MNQLSATETISTFPHSYEAHSVNRILSCLMQGLLICVSSLLAGGAVQHVSWNAYIAWCRYGTLIVIADVILFYYASGRFISSMMLIIFAFIAFQFGIPILYAFDSRYSNWYMQFVELPYLIAGVIYTVFCIQFFILGASICSYSASEGKRKLLFDAPFLTDVSSVTNIAFIGFIATGLIAIPRAALFLRMSLTAGIGVARMTYPTGGIVNIARGLFIPFGLLLLVYLPNNRRKRIVASLLIIYSLLSALAGDRTEGLTLMACLVLYFLFSSKTQTQFTPFVRGIILFAAGAALLWLLSVIAQIRMGYSARGMSIGNSIEAALGEMGFNSLTISFQMQVAPQHTYGLSYLSSLTTLIPTSVDVAGINQAVAKFAAASNYQSVMEQNYSWATFGLGYSLIAESWVNFGFAGCLAISVIGGFISRLLSVNSESLFGRYMSFVFLWAFLTLPRRDIGWLLNALEWDFLIILLCLWVSYSLTNRNGKPHPFVDKHLEVK